MKLHARCGPPTLLLALFSLYYFRFSGTLTSECPLRYHYVLCSTVHTTVQMLQGERLPHRDKVRGLETPTMGLFHEWSELNGDQTLVRRSSVELEGRALPQDPDFEMRQIKQYEYLTCVFFGKATFAYDTFRHINPDLVTIYNIRMSLTTSGSATHDVMSVSQGAGRVRAAARRRSRRRRAAPRPTSRPFPARAPGRRQSTPRGSAQR